MDSEKRNSSTHCSHCGAPRERRKPPRPVYVTEGYDPDEVKNEQPVARPPSCCSYCDTPYETPKSLQLKRVPPKPDIVDWW